MIAYVDTFVLYTCNVHLFQLEYLQFYYESFMIVKSSCSVLIMNLCPFFNHVLALLVFEFAQRLNTFRKLLKCT